MLCRRSASSTTARNAAPRARPGRTAGTSRRRIPQSHSLPVVPDGEQVTDDQDQEQCSRGLPGRHDAGEDRDRDRGQTADRGLGEPHEQGRHGQQGGGDHVAGPFVGVRQRYADLRPARPRHVPGRCHWHNQPMSRRVAVAATGPASADAGLAAAAAGGNAVDAAIAAMVSAMTTEPGIVSAAGGAFVSVWPAGGEPEVIDGNVEMPGRGQDPARFGAGLREVHDLLRRRPDPVCRARLGRDARRLRRPGRRPRPARRGTVARGAGAEHPRGPRRATPIGGAAASYLAITGDIGLRLGRAHPSAGERGTTEPSSSPGRR